MPVETTGYQGSLYDHVIFAGVYHVPHPLPSDMADKWATGLADW